ncbi:DUF4340 domain-containing protein [bacterium]|nr:DUF4340 domain-containing protein [bacterium]
MKRYLLPLGLILVSIAIALVLFYPKNSGGISDRDWEYQFGLSDTASIDSIVLSDKHPRRSTLVRENGNWTIGGYPARTDAIEVLLHTFARMEMRNFLAPDAQPEALKRMAVYGKEVQVWGRGKRLAHFFVGTDTPDQAATYMLNAGASQVFAVHMIGFNGFLSTRFITDPILWRDRQLFEWKGLPQQIKVDYPKEPTRSFTLLRQGEQWSLGGSSAGLSSQAVSAFVGAFRTLKFEGAIVPEDAIFARKDSLLASTPVLMIEVIDAEGERQAVRGYAIKPPEDTYDSQGRPLEADPDRMHGILSDGRMVLLQYFGLKTVMLTPADLIE